MTFSIEDPRTPAEPATRDCNSCLAYGCHECEYTGQALITAKDLNDDKAEWTANREDR